MRAVIDFRDAFAHGGGMFAVGSRQCGLWRAVKVMVFDAPCGCMPNLPLAPLCEISQ